MRRESEEGVRESEETYLVKWRVVPEVKVQGLDLKLLKMVMIILPVKVRKKPAARPG